jgi:very-short-patch-repair endonuclease
MFPRQVVPSALRRLAVEQAGVVTREQAIGLGFGPSGIRRLTGDGWTRLSRGVYLTSTPPADWLSLAWAGVLIGGDSARLGGLATAHLHGLCEVPPVQIEVLVAADGPTPQVAGPWFFRRVRTGGRLRATIGSPPRISVEDTVLDLIDEPDSDPKAVVTWVTSAVQGRRTTPQRILRAAQARHALRHRQLLVQLLSDVAAGARSPLEVDYLRKVERAHGLPDGRRQIRQRNTEVDVLYDEYALLVELDGRRGHEGTGRFRDLQRDNAATTDGFATLRYGYADVVGDPCEVAFQVAANLSARGWPGPLLRCHRCRNVA